MGAIKITPADKWFSLCVRKRARFQCQRCNGTPEPGGLHCSHFHGRGKWATRFDPRNGTALCMGCHLYFTAHPYEHAHWQAERLGTYHSRALLERSQDTTIAKQCKRSAKEIAKHYKAEFERMGEGEEFTAWL